MRLLVLLNLDLGVLLILFSYKQIKHNINKLFDNFFTYLRVNIISTGKCFFNNLIPDVAILMSFTIYLIKHVNALRLNQVSRYNIAT